ncbi:hypothetical protein PUN28_014819 [Cardiocondyla obscurior]|uniref:Uncharacterized protein n=1 Tax=Cardiocondyla obscurior TaxID=286306 RepID=A0AAW2EYR4_9HYME
MGPPEKGVALARSHIHFGILADRTVFNMLMLKSVHALTHLFRSIDPFYLLIHKCKTSFSPMLEIVYVANELVFPFVQTSPFFIKTLFISYGLTRIIIAHEILLNNICSIINEIL